MELKTSSLLIHLQRILFTHAIIQLIRSNGIDINGNSAKSIYQLAFCHPCKKTQHLENNNQINLVFYWNHIQKTMLTSQNVLSFLITSLKETPQ